MSGSGCGPIGIIKQNQLAFSNSDIDPFFYIKIDDCHAARGHIVKEDSGQTGRQLRCVGIVRNDACDINRRRQASDDLQDLLCSLHVQRLPDVDPANRVSDCIGDTFCCHACANCRTGQDVVKPYTSFLQTTAHLSCIILT